MEVRYSPVHFLYHSVLTISTGSLPLQRASLSPYFQSHSQYIKTVSLMPTNKHPNSDNQGHRSLLASIDILWSTFIANAVVLISLTRDRGFKKSKWKWEVISTGKEAGGSGGRVRKVEVGWDAAAGIWKNDVAVVAGKPDVEWKGERERKNKSVVGIHKSFDDISFEMVTLRKDPEEGLPMEGMARPEQARLLGEIRVAREWEVSTTK